MKEEGLVEVRGAVRKCRTTCVRLAATKCAKYTFRRDLDVVPPPPNLSAQRQQKRTTSNENEIKKEKKKKEQCPVQWQGEGVGNMTWH
ncbi:hypothetical protein ACLKA6_011428 [Drosophila palustris]